MGWSVCTVAGVFLGVKLYLVRQRAGTRAVAPEAAPAST
jgi:hypothetical protein